MNYNGNMRCARIKYSLRIILFAIALLFFSFENTAQQFLKTKGQDIINEDGEKIYLKGVGLGNWLLPEGYMWIFGEGGDRPRRIEKLISEMLGEDAAADFWKSFRANYITEADIKRIAELGFNSVRPALNSRLFLDEGDDNKFKEEGFLLLDQLIEWCKKYQLYVIIDMHGAPGGQTGTNIDDSKNNIPELFVDMHNKDLLEALWIRIAERYKDEPVVAAYDLLNEPLPEVTGAADKYKDQLVPLYKRLIKAIRKVDDKHMITIEGYNWSNNWSLFDEPLDDNVFYQFHYYCWDRPDNLKNIDYFLKKRDKLNVPVWVGETGEKGNAIYFGTSQYFEKNNIGWSFWPWKKMATVNTPYSINRPIGWEKVLEYSLGGEKPSLVDAKNIFAELEENIKLENCIYFSDVVNSMMRRAPLKIEAENYGQDGMNVSYFVNDTTFRSENYRKQEPVPVKLITFNDQHLFSEQAIQLEQNEWTKYEFESLESISYLVELRVKSDSEKSVIDIFLNGKTISIEAKHSGWEESKIGVFEFKKGVNELKLKIKKGKARIDWINIKTIVSSDTWKVDFLDDFGTFNPNNWQDQRLWVNNETHCYVPDNEFGTREVSDGTLKLKVVNIGDKRSCDNLDKHGKQHPDTEYVAGRIASKNKKEFIKGKWTARLKLWSNGEPSMFPAWWLLGAQNNEPPVQEADENICWPLTGSGEIDIFEHHGDHKKNQFTTGAIKSLGKCDKGDWRSLRKDFDASLDEYHEYSVEWQVSDLVYRVDGKEVYRNIGEGDKYPEPMFAILNFAKITDSPMEGEWVMEVDWVKHEFRK